MEALVSGHPQQEAVIQPGDRIRPHRGDPVLFWDQTNWQPLCKHHHDVKTRNEDQHPVYHY